MDLSTLRRSPSSNASRETIRKPQDDLSHGFPPLANTLIGRTEETAIVRDALLGDEIRLLTIGGPAGIGKTRLAIEVAEELAPDFPDGVWFVDLVHVSDPDQVPAAILEVLGVREDASVSALDRLHRYLQDRSILLVLDNFEHVSASAETLSHILAFHPRVCILATSRLPLRLKWEHALILDSLRVPDERGPENLEDLAAAPAVQLFVQSAQAVRLDFALTPENAEDVVSICDYLDGVPLAIELAAGWVTLLPPAAIRDHLGQQLSFLHTRTRDAPERQQSLVAALDWSYELLDERGRALLRRLSVFVNGFTIEAAGAIVGDAAENILDGIADLVDRGLLRRGTEDQGVPDGHFFLLESLRLYALDRLEEAGERDETQRQHADYFLALAEEENAEVRHVGYFIAPATLPLPGEEGWRVPDLLSTMSREYGNLRAALIWCQRAGEAEAELRLAIALSSFWWARAQLEEGIRWLDDALDRNPGAAPEQRVRALNAAGMLLRQAGQLESARAREVDALNIARAIDDRTMLPEVIINLASMQAGLSESELDDMRALTQEALSKWRERGDLWGESLAIFHLGFGALVRQQGRVAEEFLTAARTGFEAMGDLRSVTLAWLLTASAVHLQGDLGRSTLALAECVRLGHELDEPQLTASAADLAAWLIHADQPRRAAMLIGAADRIRETGFVRAGFERQLHDLVMADLTGRMREQELGLAWRQGRTATVEQLLQMPDDADASDTGEGEIPVETGEQLTDRELEVIRLMGEGKSNKEIAATIFVSEGTAKLDIRSIYRKLGAHNRAQAIGIAAERRLI